MLFVQRPDGRLSLEGSGLSEPRLSKVGAVEFLDLGGFPPGAAIGELRYADAVQPHLRLRSGHGRTDQRVKN